MKSKRIDEINSEIKEIKSNIETHAFRKHYGNVENSIYKMEHFHKDVELWNTETYNRYINLADSALFEDLNDSDRFETVLKLALSYKEKGIDELHKFYVKHYIELLDFEKKANVEVIKLMDPILERLGKELAEMKTQIKLVNDRVKTLEDELETIKINRKKNLEALIADGNLEELLEGGYKEEIHELGLLDKKKK